MKFKESETVEFKKYTAELKEAVISISAILNKHGKGELYFGIKDDGTVVGQMIGKETLRDIAEAISNHLEPKLFPHVKVKKIQGKNCIHIEFHGIHRPYFAYGRAYIRVGESDKQLSVQEMEQQFIRKNKLLWEEEMSKKKLSDVNVAAVKEYMRKARTAKRISFKFVNLKTTLHKLGLLDSGRLTKAAEVLFCDNSSMEVQAAIFAGTDKLTFLDIKQFKGNLFSLREQAETYVNEHMKWRADMSASRRVEIPEIPVRAISEAIGNSLCHRDYSNPKGNEIAIFKDRIEIYNPGKFPEDVRPEDFFEGAGRSILRNPLIAETMYKSRDIEKWASGLKRIHEECVAAHVRVEFQQIPMGSVIVFHRPKWEEGEGLIEGGQKRWPEKDTVKDTVKDTLKLLSETEKKVVGIIQQNPKATAQKIADEMGINLRNSKKYLAKLKDKGLIRRVGSDKSGHWEIVTQG
jgi:ATP-dependent DNA helicase RecG